MNTQRIKIVPWSEHPASDFAMSAVKQSNKYFDKIATIRKTIEHVIHGSCGSLFDQKLTATNL